MSRIEMLHVDCHCGKPLQVIWCNGVVSDPYHVLVADWILCVECFDEMCKGMEDAGAAV
jgi:hypothetical protein